MRKLLLLVGLLQGTAWASVPTVTISSPISGTIVQGDSVTIIGTASDTDRIAEVSRDVDGTGFSTFKYSNGFFANGIGTTEIPNGLHVYTIKAQNSSGFAGSASITLNVQNPIVQPPPPPPPPPRATLYYTIDQSTADPTISTTTKQFYMDLKNYLFPVSGVIK